MPFDVESIIVGDDQRIIDVMKAMDKSASRFAIIVDKDEVLVGVATDGDIRRGFIAGRSPEEPINAIMNPDPVVANEQMSNESMLDLVTEKFSQIPLVDTDRRVKGLISFKDKSIMLDIKSRKVCVIGLGFVGVTLAVVLSEAGFRVAGFDIDSEKVMSIKNKTPTFHEEGLGAYLNRYVGRQFHVSDDFCACAADVYIVSVGTPIDPETHRPIVKYVEEAVKNVSTQLKKGDLVLLRSTVPVGTTRNLVLPMLEQLSGLKAGVDFHLAFAPERTIGGKALSELKELPQVVGGYDRKSTALVKRLFEEITPTIVDAGNLEGAEMVKILNNTFRDVKFAFANELALVCKDLGLDMVQLVHAANQGYVRDRIPTPSPGVGGSCLTKDPYILLHSAIQLNCHKPGIVKIARDVNELIPRRVADEVSDLLRQCKKKKLKIFILGFAFKGEPETSDIRASTAIDVLNHLKAKSLENIVFFGHDPVVHNGVIEGLGVIPSSIEDGFANADAVLVMNNHKVYRNLDIFSLLAAAQDDCIFFDGWHLYPPADIKTINDIKYIGVGVRDEK